MAESILTLGVESRATGETYNVDVDMGDVYVWEKTNKRNRIMSDLDRPSAQDVYELAHAAARRVDQFSGSLDEFGRGHLVDIRDDQDEEETDPTQTARSGES